MGERLRIGDEQVPLRDRVLDELLRRIVEGVYAPGTRLREERLCEDFGVSRSPIREALRVAATEGFVRTLPRRGAVVATPDGASTADLLTVREQVEGLAARLAAEKSTEADVARLRELLDAARAATEDEDFDRVADLNTALHLEVIRIAGNAWLDRIARPMYLHIQWIFRLTANDRAPHSWTEHLRLVDAIASSDPAEAEAAAAGHVRAARLAALSEMTPRQEPARRAGRAKGNEA